MKITWVAVLAFATSVLTAPVTEPNSLEAVELLPEGPQGQPAPDTALAAQNMPNFEVEEAILITLLAQIKFEAQIISP